MSEIGVPERGQPPLQEELGAWQEELGARGEGSHLCKRNLELGPRSTGSAPEDRDPGGEAFEGTRKYASTGQGAWRGGLQSCTNKNRMSHECQSQFKKWQG